MNKLNEKKKKENYKFPSLDKNWKPEDVLKKTPKIKFLKWNSKKIPQKKVSNYCKLGVIEIIFKERTKKNFNRRMLATSTWGFLSDNTLLFGWKSPKGIAPRSKQWYTKRKLVIVQDLIMKSWRMISCDDFKVINWYPLTTIENQETFIKEYQKMIEKYGYRKLQKWQKK